MSGSYLMLSATLIELKNLQGIIFYSYEMLLDNVECCEKFLKKVINKKKDIYFALEELHVKSNNDLDELMSLIKLKINQNNFGNINISDSIILQKKK